MNIYAAGAVAQIGNFLLGLSQKIPPSMTLEQIDAGEPLPVLDQLKPRVFDPRVITVGATSETVVRFNTASDYYLVMNFGSANIQVSLGADVMTGQYVIIPPNGGFRFPAHGVYSVAIRNMGVASAEVNVILHDENVRVDAL